MSEVELTVIIAAQGGVNDAEGCIRSIVRQPAEFLESVEIIVVHHHELDPSSIQEDFHRSIRFVVAEERSLPRMLGTGASRARGRFIALTESCCRFDREWLSVARRAIEELPSSVIGGSVEPGEDLSYLDLSMYLCDYPQFARPWTMGAVAELPGCNVLFPRDLLPAPEDLAIHGLWKTFLCRKLVARGTTLVARPAMLIYVLRRLSSFDWIARRLRHGRCFGAMRAAELDITRRILYAIGAPVVAGLVLVRTSRTLWNSRTLRRRSVIHAPGIFVGVTTWIIGEWLGNLFGSGSDCENL